MAHSCLATPSATRDVLARHGLATKKSLGQHFLVDDNIIGRIQALADLHPHDVVLEVGPGIGTLTVALCDRAAAVVAVERDRDLLAVLAETTEACPRLAVLHADAVAITAEQIAQPFGPPSALVANLPYAVAATVVLRFFEILPTLSSATVMVQSEVAARMSATPGSKDYGSYTVKLRLRAEPAGQFPVARTCFMPPPRVDSAVLRLVRKPLAEDEQLIEDASRVADAAFAQRRKQIRNSLKSTLGVPVAIVDVALREAGIDGSTRAETLAPERYLTLASALRHVQAEGMEIL